MSSDLRDQPLKKGKTLFLFDIDGTLCEPRLEVKDNMVELLKNLHDRKDIEIACVSCSNMKNAKKQLKDAFPFFNAYYTENGLVTYDKDLNIIHQKSMKELLGSEKYNNLIKFLLDYIDKVEVPFKVGNFLDERSAVINAGPVGNPITKEQREEYRKWENEHHTEEVLQNRPVTAAPVAVAAPVQTVVQDADEVEELAEDLDEVEEVEELAEDAEEVDEVEELAEDVDDADEVEELAEEVDDAEEVDELEEEVEDLAEEEVDELEEEVEDLAEEEVDELAEESDDEIEELQGVDEFDSILKMLGGAMRYEYKPSDETYFASEDFPTVDNLFGEELYIGDRDRRINTKEFPIKVYPLPEYMEETPAEEVIEETPVSEETPVEEIEEKASADDDFIDADIIDEPLLEEKTELPPESNEAELEEAEEVEDVEEAEESEASEEEIPALDSATDFLLAGFAENISESTPELEAALAVPKAPENTIIEKDGVYSIAENLEYTNIVQDAEFKELVDSIL